MDTLDLLKQLEINFKLISNDLEFASHKLDAHFTSAARADDSMPDLHALQSRIEALQASIPGLAKDAAEVVRERKGRERALNASLLESYDMMVWLYARLGVVPDPDWVAVAQDIKSSSSSEANDPGAHGEEGEHRPEGSSQAAEGADSVDVHADRAEDDRRRARTREISEEDFLAVASNTRGRCKLDDVRKVYEKVRSDYQEKASHIRPSSKPKPIMKKELDAAGLKVFGLTGESIINTLRVLGLVTVTKDGITLRP